MLIIPDKDSFLKGIGSETEYDSNFFMKVYGYSVCDNSFLPAVAAILTNIGRKDIIQAYNEWFTRWKAEDDKVMKSVAAQYCEEQRRLYGHLFKDKPERRVNAAWTTEELLLRKKKLLLEKKLLMQKSKK